MNITKDFHEYVNTVKNTLCSNFNLKYERYGPMDKCTRILRMISEADRSIEAVTASKYF